MGAGDNKDVLCGVRFHGNELFSFNAEEYGWPVRTGSSGVGVSHIHSYYRRLYFALDGGDDDRFQAFEFVDGANGARTPSQTSFANKAARSVNPATQRFWRVYDSGTQNGAGQPISYDILALETGHSDIGLRLSPEPLMTFTPLPIKHASGSFHTTR